MPLLVNPIPLADIVKSFSLMFLLAATISALGIILASLIKTMQGFQVITNFFLMPMFFISRAIFPLLDAPRWMIFLSRVNPSTYGIDAVGYAQGCFITIFPVTAEYSCIVGTVRDSEYCEYLASQTPAVNQELEVGVCFYQMIGCPQDWQQAYGL